MVANGYESMAKMYAGQESCFNCDLVALCSIYKKFKAALDVAEEAGALTFEQGMNEFLPLLGVKCAQRTTDFDYKRDVPENVRQFDLPIIHICMGDLDCGFSVVDNIMVVWDEDHDDRVLQVLAQMLPDVKKRLIAISENKACLTLIWSGKVPTVYPVGYQFTVRDGDGVDVGEDYFTVLANYPTPNKRSQK